MIKKKLLLFFILFLPFVAIAEYNGHQIAFSIDLKDGSQIIGYNYLASIYQKDQSISYQEFLENNYEVILRNQFNDSLGEFTYFTNRIKYKYTDFDGNYQFIYTLTNEKNIDKNTIEALRIIELTDQSYAIGISTNHHWSDRIWMNTQPVEKQSFGGTFCAHDIYIHEKTSETDRIIALLNEISINFEEEIRALQEEVQRSDGTPYYQAKEKIAKLEEEIDHKVSDLLQRFNGMKVVIITMCTC